MKTHEFAYHLELLASLLRSLPNTELDDSLTAGFQSSLPSLRPFAMREASRTQRPLTPGIEKQLLGKSPAEIEIFLGSEDEAFTVAQFSELADRLGVPTSKRQSKSG